MAQALFIGSANKASSHQSAHVPVVPLRQLQVLLGVRLVSVSLCSLRVSLAQEIPLFSTLDFPTVARASQKQGPYFMSECLETQPPQKLPLSLLSLLLRVTCQSPSRQFSTCRIALKCYFCLKFSGGKKGTGMGAEGGMSISERLS